MGLQQFANARLTGLDNQKMLGVGWTGALHPEDKEKVLALWKQVPAGA